LLSSRCSVSSCQTLNELKSPGLIPQGNASEVQQQIITTRERKGKGLTGYRMIQDNGTQELQPEGAEKAIRDMEKHRHIMMEFMQRMQEQMQTFMQEIIQSIIMVPENNTENKEQTKVHTQRLLPILKDAEAESY
jgi:hypothetical protein